MAQNKTIIKLGTLTEATPSLTANNDSGFLQVSIGNCRLDVIVNLTAVAGGDVSFTVAEMFSDTFFDTGNSGTADVAPAVKEIVSANFPLMGKGAYPKVTAAGTATSYSADVYLIGYSQF